ncbi:AAA family ATPase [Actinocrispum sp. NPDC049592]|uniref:helix-turn-helix transcriptional regulator n=1 Tax=Actinocrispum sp. NPDC049592 TaxID=3154835 RepID=UPI0034208B33
MRIVGREAEQDLLTQAITDVLFGNGRVALLRGEAGIGKSRLAEYALDLARHRGLRVLRGQAHPLHAGLAYAPVVEAIRPHLGTLADHSGLEQLGRLLADPRLPAPRPSVDPELERTQMFAAVTEFIARLAPAVLFVDDLHWADRGTVELVHYIGQNTRDRKVLVLGAYRPSEAGSPLDDLAATVRRHPGGEVTVTPLPDAAVADLVGDLLGEQPAAGLLDTVTARAKGVPLFVTALVHQGFTADATLPLIVRDVVLGRLQALDETQRRLLEIISVAGDAATDTVVRTLLDESQALRALVIGGLITEQTVSSALLYRVAHPLYAEVAYSELTLAERRSLHAAVLRAIERTSPDDVLALAPHYREAGDLADPVRAAEILADAGWRALSMGAADEAIRYLEAAADQAEEKQVPALLDGIARAHQSLGRFDEATAAWQRATAVAQHQGQTDIVAEVRFRMAILDAQRYDSTAANERIRAEARALSQQSPEAAVQDFIFTMRHGTLAEAVEVSKILAGYLDRDHSPATQGVGCLGAGVLRLFDRDAGTAITLLETGLTHAVECEDEQPYLAHYLRVVLSGTYLVDGDMPRMHARAQELFTKRALMDIPSLWCWEQYIFSFNLYLQGDLPAAQREIERGVAVAREAGLPRSLACTLALRAFLLAEQGKVTEAVTTLAECKRAYLAPEQGLYEVTELAAAAIAWHEGGRVVSAPFSYYSLFNDPCASVLRGLHTGLAALRNGDRDLLAKTEQQLRVSGTDRPRLVIACADRLRGLQLNDSALLADVATRFASMGAPLLAAQTAVECAELTGDKSAIPGALQVFERSGAAPWADRTRRLARSLGLRMSPARSDGVLTKRESEVLRLLGEGLSNADIAARLYLSERTIETHLRNAYGKLGLTSRVAMARWAVENL